MICIYMYQRKSKRKKGCYDVKYANVVIMIIHTDNFIYYKEK